MFVVTRKSLPITFGFVVITCCQLALGIWAVVSVIRGGGEASSSIGRIALIRKNTPFFCNFIRVVQTLPQIPLDAYHVCVFVGHKNLEIVYTGISLLYGALEQPQIQSRQH
jgi:hypothetical protein